MYDSTDRERRRWHLRTFAENWNTLGHFAWDNYCRNGRGLLALRERELMSSYQRSEPPLLLPDYCPDWDDREVNRLIGSYRPQFEMMVAVETMDGDWVVYRLRTPDDCAPPAEC